MAINKRMMTSTPVELILPKPDKWGNTSDNRVIKHNATCFNSPDNSNGGVTERKNLYEDPYFDTRIVSMAPDFDAIHRELVTYFAAHPRALMQMNRRMFELLLDAVFFNRDYETVLGAGQHDSGIDIRLWRKKGIGEVLTLVHAIRDTSKNPVQIETVKALAFDVGTEKANTGLFVTTSRYLPAVKRFDDTVQSRLIPADSNEASRWCRAFRK